MYMTRRRTTIEVDDALLERARQALGERTMRRTIEEALRRVADQLTDEAAGRAASQSAYLERLPSLADLDVLRSDAMWR